MKEKVNFSWKIHEIHVFEVINYYWKLHFSTWIDEMRETKCSKKKMVRSVKVHQWNQQARQPVLIHVHVMFVYFVCFCLVPFRFHSLPLFDRINCVRVRRWKYKDQPMYTNMKLCFKEFDFITIVGYQLRQQNNNITIFLTFEQRNIVHPSMGVERRKNILLTVHTKIFSGDHNSF